MIPFLLVLAQTSTIGASTLPSTPPEILLNNYLHAYNDGGGANLGEFLRQRFEWPKDRPGLYREVAQSQLRERRMSGGYDLGRIREQTPTSIVADVRSRRLGTWSRLTLFLSAEAPDFKKPTLPYSVAGMAMNGEPAPEKFLPAALLTDREISRRLDLLMHRLVDDDAFSGVVLVARRGKPLFSHAYGLANRSYDVPNTLAMRFNLASITKMFTAVAVAQLVEAGKLSYDDPVGKIIPDYPNADVAKRVTVHHLLSHTSGIIDVRSPAEENAPMGRTIAEGLSVFVNEPLSFPPGERFSYSNSGFILLGRIVEKASGQDYYDYVREHVFRPAGMTQSGFLRMDVPNHNVASGYADGPDGTRRDNIFALGLRGSPAGGAYATAGDMDRFARALMDGRLVSPATRERMWTGVTSNSEDGTSYGYGASVARYAGRKVVGHGGGWKGITDRFEFYPELGITVTILGNTDSDPNAIAYKIREWTMQGGAAVPPREGGKDKLD